MPCIYPLNHEWLCHGNDKSNRKNAYTHPQSWDSLAIGIGAFLQNICNRNNERENDKEDGYHNKRFLIG
jgi:hypothetical protein